jgi:hypothetical protein
MKIKFKKPTLKSVMRWGWAIMVFLMVLSLIIAPVLLLFGGDPSLALLGF